jgi:hypothetical protein
MSGARLREQITGNHHKNRQRQRPPEFRFSGDYWLAVCHWLDHTRHGTPESAERLRRIVHGDERVNGRSK